MKKLLALTHLTLFASLLGSCSTPEPSLGTRPARQSEQSSDQRATAMPPARPGGAAPKADAQPRRETTNFEAIVHKMGEPVTFDQVFVEIQRIPRFKDEFETTSQFEERQANGLAKCASRYLIAVPVDPEYVSYDADRQTLIVATYALTNTSVSSDELSSMFGYGSDLSKAGQEIEYSISQNVAWSFPRESNDVGTYQGSNAFGATVRITKQERVARGIFERPGKKHQEDVWVEAPEPYVKGVRPVAFEIKVDPSTAKVLKENGLRAAILVAPRAPFHASGVDRFSPTIRAPIDRTTEVRYLIADIQCAAIYDSTGKLLASRPTR